MELNLELSLSYVPRTISEMLREVSKSRDCSIKLGVLDDYVKRLEDEMRKIDAFKRELPLSMLLLNDAIVRLKEEITNCGQGQNRSLFEEKADASNEKKSWMSSVQLWTPNDENYKIQNEYPESQLKLRREEQDGSVPENPNCGNNKGAFVPFKGNYGNGKNEVKEVSSLAGLFLTTPLFSEQNKFRSKLQRQASRKQRRCWSPELHRRFVDALQKLGGSQVATPKQIRDLMQVDGLTNDEVKSHLQKYRLHIRRLPASSATTTDASISQSGSPEGPLPASGSPKGISSTGEDSMDAEDDAKSEVHSGKIEIRKPERIFV